MVAGITQSAESLDVGRSLVHFYMYCLAQSASHKKENELFDKKIKKSHT